MSIAATTAVLAVAGAPAASAQEQDLSPRYSHGVYQEWAEGANAVTYNTELVPEGAKATILSQPIGNGTTVIVLNVTGLKPDREYGAHVHVNPCGPTGDHAGPHFQQVPDPNPPSTDPEYANPENEVWLDFVTDSSGNAVTEARGDWQPRGRNANSFVIHEHHTHTAPGEAGEAGERLACLNAQF